MPSNVVKSLAKEAGKSEKEAEKMWNEAKKITTETFGTEEKDFSDKEWAYTTGVLKKMLGLKESKESDIMDFLTSDMTAEKYIETLTSTQAAGTANIDLIAKKPEEEEEEEDQEENCKKKEEI